MPVPRCPNGPSGSSVRWLVEQVRHVARSLVRREEGDDDLSRAAVLTSQALSHLPQWKAIAEVLAQFLERKPCGVLALTAVRAVVVRIIDVCEGCSLEFGVFHMPTLTPVGCGLLLYNSYSLSTRRALYNDMRADAARRLGNARAAQVAR